MTLQQTTVASLQHMPQSVTVYLQKRCSFWVWWASSRLTMSYVRKTISWKVRLLCWNQEPSLMDLDSEHLDPATFLRHRQRNTSGILGSAHHTISRQQVLQCTLQWSKPTSFKNCIAMAWSQNKNVRNILLGPPLSRSMVVRAMTSAITASPADVSRILPLHHRYYAPFSSGIHTQVTFPNARNGC